MTGHGGENSLEYQNIKASELYPVKKPDISDPALQVPFPSLSGEGVEYIDKTTDGVIVLSSFRLFVRFKDWFVNRPLGLIECVEYRDMFYIYVCCKDGHSFKCKFETPDLCLNWYHRLCEAITPATVVSDSFAFAYLAHCKDAEDERMSGESGSFCGLSEGGGSIDMGLQLGRLMSEAQSMGRYSFDKEVQRMQYNLKSAWRITHINKDYKVCQSYPQQHIVPHCITDEDLKLSANFRAGRRFPSVVWRHKKNGAVLVRCSQPEMGFWGWRNKQDEEIMCAISRACAETTSTSTGSSTLAEENGGDTENKMAVAASTNGGPVTSQLSNGLETEYDSQGESRMMIVDARSYAAAVANRAKGGGCECIEYYPNCDIDFMGLANIHAIRKSFHAVRNLCSSGGDQTGWFQALDTSKWLHHLSSLLRATNTVVDTLDKKSKAVLIHCSDGWDRTPQISALAQLLLDPYYRTHQGFRVLIEKEWLDYGHKFSDRCGLAACCEDTNERCPVFLQWLDAVHQLLLQFPRAFQFNESYLVKLVQHTYSSLFGTFLCNNTREREMAQVSEKTGSVWGLLHPKNRNYFNHLYSHDHFQVLEPSYQLKDLQLWRTVYMYKTPPSAALLSEDFEGIDQETRTPSESELTQVLTKTRSCENLCAATTDDLEGLGATNRRLSDPSVTLAGSMTSSDGANTATVATNGTDNMESSSDSEDSFNSGNEAEIDEKQEVRQLNGECECPEPMQNGTSYLNGTENGEINGVDVIEINEQKNLNGHVVYYEKRKNSLKKRKSSDKNTISPSINGVAEENGSDISNDIPNVHSNKTNIPSQNGTAKPEDMYMSRTDIPGGGGGGGGASSPPKFFGYNKALNGSTGSNITLVSEDDSPEIAEDARTLIGNETEHRTCDENSINNHATSNGDCSELKNGHCDTLSKCSTDRKAARNEDKNGQTPSCSCDKTCEESSAANRLRDLTRTSQDEKHVELNGGSATLNGNICYHRNGFASPCVACSQVPKSNSCFNEDPNMSNCYGMSYKHGIRHARAASTSTSDISDSHVTTKASSFFSEIQKANSMREEEAALAKLEIAPERVSGRAGRLHLDISASLLHNGAAHMRRDTGRDGSSSSNTPSPCMEKSSGYLLSRPGLWRFIDVDGLNTLEDPNTAHALNLHAYYGARLRKQQRIINTLVHLVTASRNGGLSAAKLTEDLLQQCESEDEAASLGAHSNAASDVSWEQVTSSDADMTLWVPDHVVTHCAGCDCKFWIAKRKHHCRNCGQVFCNECAKYYTPVPRQQLCEPVRVCRTCYQAMGGATSVSSALIGPEDVALETSAQDPEMELKDALEESTGSA